jgi:hypothetical protein
MAAWSKLAMSAAKSLVPPGPLGIQDLHDKEGICPDYKTLRPGSTVIYTQYGFAS